MHQAALDVDDRFDYLRNQGIIDVVQGPGL